MRELLISHEYQTGTVPGNCGSRLVFRLNAKYTTEAEAKSRYERIKRDKALKAIRYNHSHKIEEALRNIRLSEGRANMAQARAYPIDWAFAATLQAIHYGDYALVCLTDTENGEGDGHKGAFATRHFARWLQDNGLMEGHMTTGTRYINDPEYQRNLHGWFLAPNAAAINKYLSATIKDINKYIEKSNRDPGIKEAQTAHETELGEQKEALEAGWRAYGIGENPIPAEDYVEDGWGGRIRINTAANTDPAVVNTTPPQHEIRGRVRSGYPGLGGIDRVAFERGRDILNRVQDLQAPPPADMTITDEVPDFPFPDEVTVNEDFVAELDEFPIELEEDEW